MPRAKKKNVKKLNTPILVAVFTVVLLFFSLASLILVKADLKNLKSQSDNVNKLLREEPYVLGRSCGILSNRVAKDILPSQKLSLSFTNAPTKNKVILGGVDDEQNHWSDSCRYVDKENSNKYVEMFIETYLNEETAKRELKDSLPVVGSVDIENIEGFSEVYYSAGAWFARNGAVIIKVSANDGRSGDLKDFSKNIFVRLTSEL